MAFGSGQFSRVDCPDGVSIRVNYIPMYTIQYHLLLLSGLHDLYKPKVQFRSFVALEYIVVMKGMENYYLSGIIIHI